ncbi:MAG: NAD(P)/FAD-dependent oxidoreductase [Planctomycetia bacterium]|nr:NAD(P)/FAD-dependent oxidoreductase [Planctomycetia bacterium]
MVGVVSPGVITNEVEWDVARRGRRMASHGDLGVRSRSETEAKKRVPITNHETKNGIAAALCAARTETQMAKTQLAVVGGGPGGYTAAFLAADLGLQVTLIESDAHPGGVCLNRGCIPSKSLLHVARTLRDVRDLETFGVRFDAPQVDIDALRTRMTKIIGTLRGGLATLIVRRGIRLIHGRARFVDSHTLAIEPTFSPDHSSDHLTGNVPVYSRPPLSGGTISGEMAPGGTNGTTPMDLPLSPGDSASGDVPTTLGFDHLILATGSVVRPAPFPIPPELRGVLWDSTSALAIPEIPRRLLVVGAGFVGLELASAYAALGSRVTIVETQSGILPDVDADLVRLFERLYLRDTGIRILRQSEVVAVRRPSNGTEERLNDGMTPEPEDSGEWEGLVEVELRDATGNTFAESFDRILVSTGRTPMTADLGLERTRVRRDRNGFVVVDSQQRTSEGSIFAVGDCTPGPMLAHRAIHEAKIAVSVLAGGKDEVFEPLSIPNVIYADPELAWTGETERSAAALGRTVEVASFPWSANGRSHAEGDAVGVTKWIFEPKSQRIIGCGIVGRGASELIGEAALAIEKGAGVHELAELIHPHPTRSETLSCAAELQLGTATEIYRPRHRDFDGANS